MNDDGSNNAHDDAPPNRFSNRRRVRRRGSMVTRCIKMEQGIGNN